MHSKIFRIQNSMFPSFVSAKGEYETFLSVTQSEREGNMKRDTRLKYTGARLPTLNMSSNRRNIQTQTMARPMHMTASTSMPLMNLSVIPPTHNSVQGQLAVDKTKHAHDGFDLDASHRSLSVSSHEGSLRRNSLLLCCVNLWRI